MPVETFTAREFQAALPAGWRCVGYEQGELTYRLPTVGDVEIIIRSSIRMNGASAAVGEDSIRAWLVTPGGAPISHKVNQHTTRVAGWQGRLGKVIQTLTQWRKVAGDCPKCQRPKGIYQSQTSKNPGRMFAKCIQCEYTFEWLDSPRSQPYYAPNTAKAIAVTNSEDELENDPNNKRLLESLSSELGTGVTPTPSNGLASGTTVDVSPVLSLDKLSLDDLDDSASPRPAGSIEQSLEVASPVSFLSKRAAVRLTQDEIGSDLTAATSNKGEFVPSRYQEAIYEFLKAGSGNGVVIATAGSGKCLGKGTPVLMLDGRIVPVEWIREGDELMGPDSMPRLVTSTTVGYGTLVRIVPVKGDPFVCNTEHILTLVNSKTDEVTDISVRDFDNIVRHSNQYLSTISRSDAKLFRCSVDFDGNETSIPPYMMGLWLGDGDKAGPHITTADQEIIDYCQWFAKANNTACVVSPDRNHWRLRFSVNSQYGKKHSINYVWRSLKQGFRGGEKRIPREYLVNTRERRLQLLAGLIDTDGYISKSSGNIVSKYLGLANDIAFLCRSLGFAAYIRQTTKSIKSLGFTGIYYSVNISGDFSIIPVLLERKKAKPRRQVKDVLRTGFKIEPIGDGDYYGFTITGDGRFLLGDFTVTHNTSTIRHATPYLPRGAKIAAIAFNRRNALDLQRVMPDTVRASTFHSLGLSNVKRAYKNIKVDADKTWHIIRDMGRTVGRSNPEVEMAIETDGAAIHQIVGLAKNILSGTTPDDIDCLCEHYGISLESHVETVSEIVSTVLNISNDDTYTADFDDMLWWCATGKVPCEQFDFLLIDELQDTNQAQIEFIKRSLRPGARVLGVGDSRQAIYSFRGAAPDAMEQVITHTGASTLPLSITYRLPLSHVEYVNRRFPDVRMEARPGAPEGEIKNLGYSEMIAKAQSGDLVICRVNAPLVEPCFELIRQGRKATIAGRDIGKGLTVLLTKMEKKHPGSSLSQLLSALRDYAEREIGKLLAARKGNQAGTLSDQVETLLALSDGAHTTGDIRRKVEAVFSDDAKGVIFSSGHRAKGSEAEHVYYFHPELVPHRLATEPWQLQAESNIDFVMSTRSKHGLYFTSAAK